jgi:hypothetical protein
MAENLMEGDKIQNSKVSQRLPLDSAGTVQANERLQNCV